MHASDPHTIHRPSRADLVALADAVYLSLNDEELEDYHSLVDGALATVSELATIDHHGFRPDIGYTDRQPGYRPDDDEDPYNAWITKGRVAGRDDGPLDGLTVGLKDNVALAGYEMTAGSTVLEGYVPQVDATVVTRLLDGGATVVGKTNMEAFAFSGSSSLCDFGTVTNPRDTDYLVGGSSSGSAAAVAAGDCDVAIGGDQAGSIRIPSAWAGIVGFKPTRGLVPYTGIVPIDIGYDHTGPMARDVESVARTLEALAGEDIQDGLKMDPRQPRGVTGADYTGELATELDEISIGVLEEGFDWDCSDPVVDDAVRDAIGVLEELGARTERVSMALHRESEPILSAIAIQGGGRILQEGGVGTNHVGWYWEDLIDALGKFSRSQADDFPPTVKTILLTAEHLRRNYNVSYYAKAKNVALEAERRYNRLLETHDALVMPTTPMQPFERDETLDRVERVARVRAPTRNTGLFNVTGHPAISVPCANPDGLPVGMMVVGSQFDESTVLGIAHAFEKTIEWTER